ncbi:PepSY domain-containing protein [Methylobacter sp.]|uniref:PepSY-associated TM helix domain-containing protein n=1 Tax=Methylobacter sp. TaxID=2051955 RepID=UPI002488BCFD|nr:PepSY-associated TM helix domain-containing protein [Methylobacter sp.]MDI1276559.1 PepSY-associated TM helix domain-containing protein [Methylobacter sp.]MDI1357213.1 PepSY-associated TM helix domain-containing protein [Methylobacter sp.]
MKRFAIDLPYGEAFNDTDAGQQRLLRFKKHRKLWLSVHLWLGLLLGFFLAVFGITGSMLVFYEEIDNVLNADLRIVQAPKQGETAYRALAEIQAAAVAAMPPQAKLGFVDYPAEATSSYKFGFVIPTAVADEKDEWQVHVNPYTAQVLGKHLIKKAGDIFPSALIPFVFRLHFALLSGATGGIIVGIMGIILLFSVLTGLIVWWPLTGNWRRVLSIKPRASAERFNHDLHQTSGFYTFPILFVVLLSGVYMNLPDQFMALVKQLSPGTQGFMDNPHSLPAVGKKPIGLAQALSIVQNRYPEGRIDWLNNPDGETGVYRISISDVPNLSRFWSERQVSVDQYTGTILKVQDPGTRSTAGQTFVEWQWPLHSGRAFGWIGRILIFLTGLACPVLFITGLIRWLQKRRAKLHRSID